MAVPFINIKTIIKNLLSNIDAFVHRLRLGESLRKTQSASNYPYVTNDSSQQTLSSSLRFGKSVVCELTAHVLHPIPDIRPDISDQPDYRDGPQIEWPGAIFTQFLCQISSAWKQPVPSPRRSAD